MATIDINRIGNISIPQEFLVNNLEFYEKLFNYINGIPVKVEVLPYVPGNDIVFTMVSKHFDKLKPGEMPKSYGVVVMPGVGEEFDIEHPRFKVIPAGTEHQWNIIPIEEVLKNSSEVH